jgi:hypothetical protein
MVNNKIVIIRDDDVNAFTKPATLEKVYDKDFFDKGFKVSLSIIPNIDSSAKIGSQNNPFARRGYTHEPFIPKSKIDTGLHSFTTNKPVADWIRKNKSIEPCIHGYSHNIEDFTTSDGFEIQRKIAEGRGIIEGMMKKSVRTFVPPHERLSKMAWRLIVRNNLQIFRNVIRPLKDIVKTVPLGQYSLRHLGREFFYGMNGLVKYKTAQELGTMEPYLFSPFWDLEESFEHACKKFDNSNIFLMTNHHWEFDINPNMQKWWKKFVDYISQHDVRSMTATEAFKTLR